MHYNGSFAIIICYIYYYHLEGSPHALLLFLIFKYIIWSSVCVSRKVGLRAQQKIYLDPLKMVRDNQIWNQIIIRSVISEIIFSNLTDAVAYKELLD